MRLQSIALQHFRLIRSAELEFHPQLTIITGDNGAGKSSLLDAIKLFGRAKLSPGVARDNVTRGEQGWRCQASWWAEDPAMAAPSFAWSAPQQAEIRWEKGLSVRLNHQTVTAAALAREFVCGPIDWSVQRIIAEGPALRRQFLDWVLFHVEPRFHETWSAWRRQLDQRNRLLLQQAKPIEVRAWNEGLATSAERLNAYRQSLVAELEPAFCQRVQRLLPQFAHPNANDELKSDHNLIDEPIDERLNEMPSESASVISGSVSPLVTESFAGGLANTTLSTQAIRDGLSLSLDRGWTGERAYLEVLLENEARDLARRTTMEGPQRADIEIRVGGAAPKLLSRGQQKLVFAALMLAGCSAIRERRGSAPVLLVDDFAAELAAPACGRLRDELLADGGQVIVTEHVAMPGFWPLEQAAMFHVEHGQFTKAVK